MSPTGLSAREGSSAPGLDEPTKASELSSGLRAQDCPGPAVPAFPSCPSFSLQALQQEPEEQRPLWTFPPLKGETLTRFGSVFSFGAKCFSAFSVSQSLIFPTWPHSGGLWPARLPACFLAPGLHCSSRRNSRARVPWSWGQGGSAPRSLHTRPSCTPWRGCS